jgi:hypothetical protein
VANSRPDRLNAHEYRVAIAINANFFHVQYMAARLALLPQFIARPAEENRLLYTLGLSQSLLVHESQHQDLASGVILHDGRNQPVMFFKRDFHFPASPIRSKNKKPAGLFCASGPMSAFSNEFLYAPQPTRRLAVMMVVPM